MGAVISSTIKMNIKPSGKKTKTKKKSKRSVRPIKTTKHCGRSMKTIKKCDILIKDIFSEESVEERILKYCPIKDIKNLSLASSKKISKKYQFHCIRVHEKELEHKQKVRRQLEKFEEIRILQIHTFSRNIPSTIYNCIARISNLEELDLSSRVQSCWYAYKFDKPSTEVNDRTAHALCRGLRKLKVLNLSGSKVTSAGCSHLTQLSMLQVLVLSFCRHVDDEAMSFIGSISTLTSLNIDATPRITDIGISHLSNLTHLKELRTDGCYKSDVGVLKRCLIQSSHENRYEGMIFHNLCVSSTLRPHQ